MNLNPLAVIGGMFMAVLGIKEVQYQSEEDFAPSEGRKYINFDAHNPDHQQLLTSYTFDPETIN